MRVTLDYRPALIGRSGIGRYVRSLVPALAALAEGPTLDLHAVFWRGHRAALDAAEIPSSARLIAHRRPARLQALLADLGLAGSSSADLVHHTDYVRVPHRGGRSVFTLHDLAFLRGPQWYRAQPRKRIEAVMRRLVGEASLILVPSEATAADAEELLGVPADRIAVTPLGVDEANLRPAETAVLETEGPAHVLALGTLEPRKNFARLLDAVILLLERGRDVRLDLVGRPGWLWDDVSARLSNPRWADHIAYYGDARDQDLTKLMGRARLLAYPSLYEGFGLPILEGMAAGLPVLTSNRGAMAEVAGDAAELVDPESTEAIADGLARLLDDAERRRELARRGRVRAAEFTWMRCAEATRDAYARAVALGPIGERR